MNHFYIGSKINSISVSGKNIEDAKGVIEAELQNYTLTLKERESKSEQIKASDVGLKLSSGEELNKLKDTQNPFKWVAVFFTEKDCKMNIGLSYDENLLKEKIDKLSCFSSDNVVEPKNPSFKYEDNNYVIISEVSGNKVDKDILYCYVVNSMLKGENEIDLESAGCYVKPKYNSDSKETIEVKDTLNKYVSSKITYTFGEKKETLDGSIINTWLKVDDNFQITFDEKKVMAYMDTLSKTYDTVGKTRKFVTSLGNTIYINGGDYGQSIDKDKEVRNLIKDIKEGRTITKEPEYSSKTAFPSNNGDIGTTYVEINLSKQQLWFYKDGSLIVEGDVVTGNISKNHSTRKGVFKLKYKARNAILRGADYATFVNYWMPFDGGIGIHDASWRKNFGGDIYRTDGSHGCVNSPYNVAHLIYDNIKPGTPIICY
ncbi:putative peptidoglycan binding domain protein [Clostridium homopropionicum DSM 5847]|uniref:Putative peptidoglycan binding domain protein n=1 Tax=Clostridium homopropionicum DSM 5847 TaxID=1121318 RepID=A0A0L6Z6N8_9CLOT|nr:peptidoglycan binding domain-containing protein [Clostridium homopropionicum]KOA18483.1 putative peptidoglycan binding domain protein [Clostridium homopropionicum DSM 5847]SFF66052.1 peptidoglycan transpeptidase precursor, ErfK-YbiS-YhnG family [Clostridium homopropionicum]